MHINTLDAIDLARVPAGRVSPEVAFYLRNSRSPKTIEGYRWAWGRVLQICGRRKLCPLPMSQETCCEILTELADAGLAVGSVRLVLSAIAVAHRIAGEVTPVSSEAVRSTVRGIARTFADRKIRRVAAVTPIELRLVYDRLLLEPNRFAAMRDWTLLIIGFAGAFRASEIVALDTEDIDLREDRVVVMIGRSKTDQEGRGASITIQAGNHPDICPVAAIRKWLQILPGQGPVFRPISGRGDHLLPKRLGVAAVAAIVKRHAAAMGLDDGAVAGHSLRAGFVTSTLSNEIPDTVVMDHTRHKTHESLAKYFRPRSFRVNMTEGSGL